QDALDHLRQTVLADVFQPTVITSARQTAGLQGMGGIGKSVIAASFARACDTRRAFGDGVIWLRFGQQANPLRNIAAIARAFNDDPQKYLDLDDARLHLPELLATK